LLEQKGRILRAQASRHSDLGDTRRDTTRGSIDDVAVARRDGRWWIRWAGTSPWLIIVGGLASHRASIDIIAGKSESTASSEDEETGCLKDVGEVEHKVADVALGGIGIELEVEDCAEVVGRHCRSFRSRKGFGGKFGADGDQR